jgi:DNA-binding response OmpR family regulator
VVSVADTGVGIPVEEMSRLFERFQQVGDTLRDKPKGTGLGLAICREIVTHYGGVIWAESSPGVGSTFYFTMPSPSEGEGRVEAAPVYVPAVISEIRRRVNGALPASEEESPLVLIVDDEVHIRSLLVQELGEAGYRTLEAANGTEALVLTRRHRPSIVLLDVMMPDISGFDVTRVLKSDPATASIPILILSIIEDREHGLALGADAYLTKPVESGRLLGTISSLLAQEPERRTAMVAGQDRSVIEAITVVLREEGFEVVEAYDPRGAITTAQEVQPDLVILDEMLSRLNDAEILKALRFQDPSRACTIIVLSGEATL